MAAIGRVRDHVLAVSYVMQAHAAADAVQAAAQDAKDDIGEDVAAHIARHRHDDDVPDMVKRAQKAAEANDLQTVGQWRVIRDMLWHRLGASDVLPWRIYVPPASTEIVKRFLHDHFGHCGRTRVCHRAAQLFWWPKMMLHLKNHIHKCKVCAETKPKSEPQAGRMRVLDNPAQPWAHIHMDKLVALPVTPEGVDQALVVIDRATRRVHIYAVRSTQSAADLAWILAERYVVLHGLPSRVYSDLDPLFVNDLWREMASHFLIEHVTTTAYHKTTNGLVERANRVIGEMLRNYVATYPERWEKWLPLIEFVINASRSAATEYSPFELDIGYVPNIDPALRPPDEMHGQPQPMDAWLKELQERRTIAHDLLADAAAHACERDEPKRDRWKPEVGQYVMVSVKYLPNFVAKLAQKWVGPCKIVEELKDRDTYKLELPKAIEAVHPWFHVSRLKRAAAPGVPQARPEENGEWQVERVVRAKCTTGQGWRFLVRWKGYTAADDTWEPEAHLQNAKEAIAQYMRMHKRHHERYYRDKVVPKERAHVVRVGRHRSASF